MLLFLTRKIFAVSPKTAACMQGICLCLAVWYNLRKKPEGRREM